VGVEFGVSDEDRVEGIVGVDVVLEDEGAFGDEEGVFGWLAECFGVMGCFEPGVFLIAVWLYVGVIGVMDWGETVDHW